MREQTKAIRNILLAKYPTKTFKFRYINAKNYVDSSDILKITCPKDVDIDNIISLLNTYTDGVMIYRYGQIMSVKGMSDSKIYQPNSDVTIDGDMLEFIEVKQGK